MIVALHATKVGLAVAFLPLVVGMVDASALLFQRPVMAFRPKVGLTFDCHWAKRMINPFEHSIIHIGRKQIAASALVNILTSGYWCRPHLLRADLFERVHIFPQP